MKMPPLNPIENENVVVEHKKIFILYYFSQILLEKIMNYNGKEYSNFLKQEKRELDELEKNGLKKQYRT